MSETSARSSLAEHLDELVARFESERFIAEDPISIPHGFDDRADIEVIGLFAALLAWGRRSTMLSKLAELCERMGYRPAEFVMRLTPAAQAQRLEGFQHRTFLPEDAVNLVRSLHVLLRAYGSIERLFTRHMKEDDRDVGAAIQGFSESLMMAVPGTPARLRKHLARPLSGSASKRLAMYLRWMVRPGPVDFGIWGGIRADQLVMPLDVHTARQARALGLLDRKSNDWRAVMLLTERCRSLDPDDPVRYDFALFGAGVNDINHPPHLIVT